MVEDTLENKVITSSESIGHSSSATVKRSWQTPNLTELDYNQTANGIGPGGDGSLGS